MTQLLVFILSTYYFISLSQSYSMNRLIELARWIDITDDESISFCHFIFVSAVYNDR